MVCYLHLIAAIVFLILISKDLCIAFKATFKFQYSYLCLVAPQLLPPMEFSKPHHANMQVMGELCCNSFSADTSIIWSGCTVTVYIYANVESLVDHNCNTDSVFLWAYLYLKFSFDHDNGYIV